MNKRINIFFLFVLLIFSCKTNKEKFSYPFISIPEFKSKDYYDLLTDKNSEVVYNSICNLINNTADLSKIYYDESGDKASEEYLLSSNIYEKIKNLSAKSNNIMIISSCLKFLNDFIHKKDYQDTITLIEKIKNNSFTVNYEKINLLAKVLNSESKINKRIIIDLMNDRSWIISRNAYLLINSIEEEELRKTLIKKYKKAKKEEEKLLILTAFKNNFSYDFFEDIILNEIKGENQKIKDYLFGIFSNCKDKEKIIQYIINNYDAINSEDMVKIVANYKYLTNNQSLVLFINIINKGFEPDKVFYETLINKSDSVNEDKDYMANLKILTDEVKKTSKLRVNYDLAYKEIKNALNPLFIKEYDKILNEYLNKFEKTAIHYNIEKKFINEYKELLGEYLKGDKLDSNF